jgi:TonB family protein
MLSRAIIAAFLSLSIAAVARIDAGIGEPYSDVGPPPPHAPWESRYHALSMPAPMYPYEVRKQHLTVDGVIAVHVDPNTGLVSSAIMKKSTGSAILDEASLSITKKWRFEPGGPAQLEVPINFSIRGVRLGYTRGRAKGLTNRWS